MNPKLVVKAVFYTLTIPGVATLVVPYGILRSIGTISLPEFSLIRILALIFWIISVSVLLYCIWGFAAYGRGTLAPIDPPKVLVVRGHYQNTRNPMYLAVLCILLSEAVFFSSYRILIYAGVAFILFHLFVVYYEEPKLLEQFGESFEEYKRAVPRWLVRIKRNDG